MSGASNHVDFNLEKSTMSNTNMCSQPSTSGVFLTAIEDRVSKNLDKMKKKLRTKDKSPIFVCSSSKTLNCRNESISSNGSSTERLKKPDELPMGLLSIDTFGGECAGSGYDWTTEDSPNTTQNDTILQAQGTALDIAKKHLQEEKSLLAELSMDEQRLNDHLVSSYRDFLSPDLIRGNDQLASIMTEISSLEQEIANLRTLSPRCVPPERPPRPLSSQSWHCPICAMESPHSQYRCQHCKFPRPMIDPKDSKICHCPHCTVGVADRLFVSPCTEEADWMMVNRLRSTER